MITIYTDGSCKGNPGPGGFGVVVLENDKIIFAHQESSQQTTNNRQEIKAILWALENFGNSQETPIVYSDSSYCVNSFNTWIHNWKRNGWTRSKGKELENKDLIRKYDSLTSQGYKIDLRKCAGHSGNLWNDLADALAVSAITAEDLMDKYGIQYEQLSLFDKE